MNNARTFLYRAFTDSKGEPDAKAIILIFSFLIFMGSIIIFFITAIRGNPVILPEVYINPIMVITTSGFVAQAAEFYAQSKVDRTQVIEEARLEAKEANDTEVGVIARQRAQNAKMYPDVNKDKPTDFYKGLTDRGPDPYFGLYGPPRENEPFEKEPKSYL